LVSVHGVPAVVREGVCGCMPMLVFMPMSVSISAR
jgi:hypothetical protein